MKDELNTIINRSTLNPENKAKIIYLNREIAEREDEEAEVLRIMAGCAWREQSNKYFLNLIKLHRFSTSSILGLIRDDGSLITGPNDSTNHCRNFYEKLYKKHTDREIGRTSCRERV